MQKQMRFVERFRSKATKATQVQSRLKQLEKMQTIELPRTTKKVRYSFPEPPRSGAEVISLVNVSKSYGDKPVYRGVNLSLSRGRPRRAGRAERRRQDDDAEDTRGRVADRRGGAEGRATTS